MNETNGLKVSFEQKAQFITRICGEKLESGIGEDNSKPIVFRKTVSGMPAASMPSTIYIKINYKNKNRKDAYRRINKMLGEN